MNGWWVAAGGLLLALGVAHVLWARSKGFWKAVPPGDGEEAIKHASFFISWQQGGGALVLMGGLLLYTGLQDWTQLPTGQVNTYNAWGVLILMLVLVNLSAFVVYSLARFRWLLKQTVPQVVLFVILIVLIVLGLRAGV